MMVRVLLLAFSLWFPRPAEAGANPQSYRSETLRAQEALRRGRWEDAEAAAQRAQEIAPQEHLAYPLRALALSMRGRDEEAIAEIKTAIRLRPQSSGLKGVLAFALNRTGKFMEAERSVDRSIEGRPTSSWSWYQLAYSPAGLGDREGSLRSLEQAAVLEPARYGARYERARKAPDVKALLVLFQADPAIESSWFVMRQPRSRLERRIRRLPWALLAAAAVVLMVLLLMRGRLADWLVRLGMAGGGTPIPTSPGTPIMGIPIGETGSSTKAPPRLPAGYRIVRQIGAGGMGAVFEADDLALQRRVAIKRMRDEIRDDPGERGRFLKEARVVAKLRHPNIVEIHSIVEHEGEVFLIFEYLDGSSLDAALTLSGRSDIPEARRIVGQICAALTYAHGEGVIHRDLKPANIMLTKDRRVKVTDFGVAGQAREALSRLSISNTMAGTPPYMAPESETGTVRPESDLYSLAVSLYQMLTGERPFAGTSAGMLMRKLDMRFDPPSTKVPGLPPALDAFFASALHCEPEKRPRTANAFEFAFAAAVAQS
ncbi:MAG: protein kinase [Elusimicrobiota bacterium]